MVPGICFNQVRHADLKMTVNKEDIFAHIFLETGSMTYHAGPHGNAAGLVEGKRGQEGEVKEGEYLGKPFWSCGKEWVRQDKV